MKYKINIVGLIGLFCLPLLGIGQTTGIIYQATILNAQEVLVPGDDLSVNPLIYSDVSLRFSVTDASGDAIFIEEHQTKTNAFGEVKVLVGSGVHTLGVFSRIEWDGSTKQLKVEVDYGKGAGYEYSNTRNILYLPHPLNRSDQEKIKTNRELLRFIILGSGLDSEGNYINHSDLLLLSDASSLADADEMLASGIKNNAKNLDNYLDNQEIFNVSLSNTLLRIVVESNDTLTLDLAAFRDGIGTDDQRASEVYFKKPLEWQTPNKSLIKTLQTAILILNSDMESLLKNESDGQKIWLEDASLRITNVASSLLLSKYLNHSDHQNANQVFLSAPLDADNDGSSEATIEEALNALVNRLFRGCSDPLACNYFSLAREDDGSCILTENCETCSGEQDGTGVIVDNDLDDDGVCDADEVLGCMDETRCNYHALATDDDGCLSAPDGLCETCSGEQDGTGVIVDNDLDDDGVCDADEVLGCMDETRCNYHALATDDDGCLSAPDGLCETCSGEQDGTGVIVDNDLDDDGVCDADDILSACTDFLACNYDDSPTVNTDNTLCDYADPTLCETCVSRLSVVTDDFDGDGICDLGDDDDD
ncbi:hypothetical protein N9Y06_04585, partial [Flavobacteriales bacterium]|nr:hypothetical protein [Flavobacteriales bacterium]